MNINTYPVVNATKSIVVTITADDIANAHSKEPSHCAAARACVKRIPNVVEATVHVGVVYLREGKKWLRYRTSTALAKEVVAFDRGGTFEPGEYKLNVLGKSHRPNGRRLGGDGQVHKKRPKIARLRHVTTGIRHNADVR